ncbi:MAG: chitobiase/beta-hexosaminidase C-terminal domain-containing protein [bacterium]|nr:MAG: chitobiase/beta-hexosaminidase C-terminal domain-containing protein [bacterium]
MHPRANGSFLYLFLTVFLAVLASPSVAGEAALVPEPGDYGQAVRVRFQAPEGTTVRYTLDGTEPNAGSPAYDNPFLIERDTVIRYFTVTGDGRRSSVEEAFYRIRTPEPDTGGLRTGAKPQGGIYRKSVRVSLASKEGATVYFTMDGTEPSSGSDIYTSPLILTADTTLKFFAVDADGSREPVREEVYRFQLTDTLVDTTPPDVRVSPAPESYREGDLIRLTATEEGRIFYTLDGTTPTVDSSLYEGPFLLTESVQLAFFAEDASGNRSAVHRFRYILDREAPASEAYPGTGLYTSPLSVRITVSDPDARVHYTLDGSSPSERSPVYTEPLVLTGDTVLRYFSMDADGNREEVKEETYLFDDDPPVTVADPPGGVYAPPIRVSLRTEESARIHYSVDGYDPDTESPIYFRGFTFMRPTTLKFFAMDTSGNRESVQTQRYDLVNGVWRKYFRGVFLIPSVTDGRTFWMGTESGLAHYRVGSGDRRFVGDNEGLQGTVIHDLVLDERGDLWIATDRGLNRYREGSGFTYFSTDEGMPAREVLSIGVDRDGSIWAGTRNGVSRIQDDQVRETITGRDGLPNETVLSIAVDYAGNKWFGTRKGLAKFTGSEWNIFTRESGLIDNEIRTVGIDSSWNTWVGTPRGVSVFDGESWTSYTQQDGLPGSSVVLIAPDPDGEVWAATRTGVARFSGGKWVKETPP